jgi:hypothetical protein
VNRKLAPDEQRSLPSAYVIDAFSAPVLSAHPVATNWTVPVEPGSNIHLILVRVFLQFVSTAGSTASSTAT